ncbi:unnamed protein product [Paramecium primaurelia]|uniref:ABC1 atypical kinase-like domain-containing protein n=1 Tax=Paramecium primaurelia TaxID=5886 RepID=A0A8S1KBL8_PARPR|nr:unnamed protein product [Paramecium primaurelia]
MSLLQDIANAVSFYCIRNIFQEEIGKQLKSFLMNLIQFLLNLLEYLRFTKQNQRIEILLLQKFKNQTLRNNLLIVTNFLWSIMPILQYQEQIQSKLYKEIDFRIEYQYEELCRRRALQIIGRKVIHIPKYYKELNTQRILISKWIEGITISHQDKIKKLGFNTKQLMNNVICQVTKEDDVKKLQLKMKEEIKEMMKQTDLFPKDLIFVNRNMNLFRSFNKRCGSAINKINIMVRYTQKGTQQLNELLQTQQYNKKLLSSLCLNSDNVQLDLCMYFSRSDKNRETIKKWKTSQNNRIHDLYGFKTPDDKTFDA